MQEKVWGWARVVVALGAMLLVCVAGAAAQQSAEPDNAPGDKVARIRQQDISSALDATLNQDTQTQPGEKQTPADDDGGTPAMFPHFKNDRIWLSGQANFISQWHPAFHSPYSGKNSLSAEAQDASSRVLTLFTGLRLTSTSELLCDIQETADTASAKRWASRDF